MKRLLARDRRGAVSVEFAVAGVLMLSVTMGLVGAGLIGWTRSGLQAAATATARCVALGAPACAAPASYAATLAGQWVFPGIITAAEVSDDDDQLQRCHRAVCARGDCRHALAGQRAADGAGRDHGFCHRLPPFRDLTPHGAWVWASMRSPSGSMAKAA